MTPDRIHRELVVKGFSSRIDGNRVLVSIYGSKELQDRWDRPCLEAVMGPLKVFCEKNDLRYKRIGGTVSVRSKTTA